MTIAPDQGMSLLTKRMQGWWSRLGPQPGDGQDRPAAVQAEPAEHGGEGGLSVEFGIMAKLAAALHRNSDVMQAARKPRVPWEAIHQVDIFPQANNAAGTLDDPDRWGPHAGWAWEITWLMLVLGAGATAVTVYRDAAIPTNEMFTTAVTVRWEPRKTRLMPGSRLIVVSAGGGVSVNGQAEEVALDWMPEHIL